MSVKTNIAEYYNETIDHAAEMALEDIKGGADENEAINMAMDNETMYYQDQAYIVAWAMEAGYIKWGGEKDETAADLFQKVYEMLYNDIYNRIEELKKEGEN